jgi:iron complex transport system ATP-binding protein
VNLIVENLGFHYPSRQVLDGISLTLNKGECLSILGTNGVGKSTLLKCINRILRQQTGKVVVMGEDVRGLSGNELAKRIGYVSQRQSFSLSTVFDAVLLGRKPYVKWDVSRHDLDIVHGVMKSLGLEDFALRKVDELSGGEAQKVAIARALAQQSDVLMFDEPTSNLDLKNQLEVVGIIKEIVRERQISAIVTMHDLNMASRFGDKFLFLKGGRIFAAGDISIITPENIMAVYGVKVEVQHHGDIPVIIPVNSQYEGVKIK